ncbi:MAG TPA: DUF697 domain-containing protein [Phaeodactylibacter sp.]|nr:DUF697 domain-containing protein [Phaeodactylibacter sp.]
MKIKKRKIAKHIFKTVKKSMMSNSDHNKNIRSKHADTIIRNHVIWSMGAGLIPVLIADIFAVSALQLDMIRQLCKVYDVDFKETQGKAIVTSLTGSTLARLGARSVIKLIPGVGSLIGGLAVSVFAGASTYALGEVFKLHFETGGTILDFDPDRLKKKYWDLFEKGKTFAAEVKNDAAEHFEDLVDIDTDVDSTDELTDEVPSEAPHTQNETISIEEDVPEQKDILTKLKELGELKESGVINDTEFKKMKKKLIDEF